MGTVFRRIATEVKSYLHLGDLISVGQVCPFLSQTPYRDQLPEAFCLFNLEGVENP
ncbi:hypothetical protein NCCP2222_19750 [Sporosarcina sp. NCCP-2222]|uniref:hypothetical protein n=1 Tax=Sporosarcina sp. NCCP-2222 TaxID=2935073 RepID=UPI002082C789|nr:hypothetical protein [Sporosarcina sp. NCCP-2222]GKV56028.1 hypothetical protein NCCP2222_19750 [Sporosarcina sp. NCCP-2222]